MELTQLGERVYAAERILDKKVDKKVRETVRLPVRIQVARVTVVVYDRLIEIC